MNDLDKFENCELYEEEYMVEKILDKKKYKGIWKYKVKWEGYSYNECTWEPKENLSNCKEMIERFERDWEEKNLKNVSKNNSLVSSAIKENKSTKIDEDEEFKKIKKMRIEEKEEEKMEFKEAILENKNSEENQKISEPKEILTNLSDSELLSEQSIKSFNSNVSCTTDVTMSNIPEGNLDDDIPIKIESAQILDDVNIELNCLVSWSKRDDGVTPKNTWISSNIIRKKNAELLLKYYETKVKFPQRAKKVAEKN
jgi:hypothetical protein